jgi:hypothetical protein
MGAIRVMPDRTEFEIVAHAAEMFAANAAERDPRAPHVEIVPADASAHRPLPKPVALPHGAARPHVRFDSRASRGGGHRPPSRKAPHRRR